MWSKIKSWFKREPYVYKSKVPEFIYKVYELNYILDNKPKLEDMKLILLELDLLVIRAKTNGDLDLIKEIQDKVRIQIEKHRQQRT